jgi:hypothetical protein
MQNCCDILLYIWKALHSLPSIVPDKCELFLNIVLRVYNHFDCQLVSYGYV